MSVFMPFWAKPEFNKSKPLLIYGYGLLCLNWLRIFHAERLNILAIFDRDTKFCSQTITGIPILPPERIGDFERDCNVFISTQLWTYESTKLFRSFGFKNIYWNCMQEIPEIELHISRSNEYAAIIKNNHDDVNRAKYLFGEGKSLDTFLSALDAYGNGNFERLGSTASRATIADFNIFDFNDYEVYADVGAYTGDTALEFARIMKYKYKRIYSFEPSELEFKIIEKMFAYYKLDNAEVHQFAICNSVGEISFTTDNSQEGAKIATDGDAVVQSTTLDSFFLSGKRDLLPSYIHMDIEGAEVNALEGARKLISNHLPKLSISSYHKLEHYWEVPLMIEDIAPGKYEFFMRHYGNLYDTMCLARPKGSKPKNDVANQ